MNRFTEDLADWIYWPLLVMAGIYCFTISAYAVIGVGYLLFDFLIGLIK